MKIWKNDWSSLKNARFDEDAADLISIIIPAHTDQETLDNCLTALQRQSLPRESYEIVVVDHKSEPPLSISDEFDNVVYTRLDEGNGPGAARHHGTLIAKGAVFVFVDVDIIASPAMVEAYAAAPTQNATCVTLGFRSFINSDLVNAADMRKAAKGENLESYFAGKSAADSQNWITDFLSKRDQGLKWSDDLWVVIVGAGLGIHRSLYSFSGGFRDYVVHGVEDTEFGWRLFQAGAVIMPVDSAHGYHIGARTISKDRDSVNFRRSGYIANAIPHVKHRPPLKNRIWDIPKVIVEVSVSEASDAQDVISTCNDILSGSETDLLITIDGNADLNWTVVQGHFECDARVLIKSGSGEIPVSTPYLVKTTAGVRFSKDSIVRIIDALNKYESGLVALVSGSDTVTVEAWRTAAIARGHFIAQLSGGDEKMIARETHGDEWLPGTDFGVGSERGAGSVEYKNGRWYVIPAPKAGA